MIDALITARGGSKRLPNKNIKNFCGKPLISWTIEAAKLSCAHDFITKLPGGYNYKLVENGANLSGGQRQSIALARCLIRKPKLLVLDEPTSSMDGATEERIINNIMSLSYNPTLIISTHRTNHLLRVDKIGVIIDGNLVQYGPRDEIVKHNNPENKG